MFKVMLKQCSLCNKTVWINRLDRLKKNHHDFEKQGEIPKDATVLCKPCYDKYEYVSCTYTGKEFLGKDQISEESLEPYREKLFPYHPEVESMYPPISPEGFRRIEEEAKHVDDLCTNSWAGGTKGEFIRGYHIEKEIGLIREDEHFDSPAEIEEILKLHVAQRGGNGYIKFFWERHVEHHSETVEVRSQERRRTSHQTRKTYYTGAAVAVYAIPSRRDKKPRKTARDR